MNWKGWILGLVITLLQTSITGFNVIGQFPNANPNQLTIILYPVVVGMLVNYLIKSPVPGAVLPPGVANGIVTATTVTKPPEGGAK